MIYSKNNLKSAIPLIDLDASLTFHIVNVHINI